MKCKNQFRAGAGRHAKAGEHGLKSFPIPRIFVLLAILCPAAWAVWWLCGSPTFLFGGPPRSSDFSLRRGLVAFFILTTVVALARTFINAVDRGEVIIFLTPEDD